MHNTFGRAGGAAGIKDIQRIIEVDGGELCDRFCRAQRCIENLWLWQPGQIGRGVQERNDQRMCDRRQGLGKVAQNLHTVKRLASIAVAITRNQQCGFDLSEPVGGTANAEIRGTA